MEPVGGSRRAVPGRAVPGRAVPGRAVPGRAVPGRAVPPPSPAYRPSRLSALARESASGSLASASLARPPPSRPNGFRGVAVGRPPPRAPDAVPGRPDIVAPRPCAAAEWKPLVVVF
jgi:hypothetical protein